MLPMRLTVVGAVIFTLFMAAAVAQEKGRRIDPYKLIGIWTMDEEPTVRAEFTKDGEHTVFAKIEDEKTIGAKGTYRLVGDQLTITAELNGSKVTETCQVKVLTDDVLIYQVPGEKGTTKFVKKKPAVVSKPIEPKTKK